MIDAISCARDIITVPNFGVGFEEKYIITANDLVNVIFGLDDSDFGCALSVD